MLRETGILELSINHTTAVSDLEKALDKGKIYNMKHPTIRLLPENSPLANEGLILLFLALSFMEESGKMKRLLKRKNGKHPLILNKTTGQRVESLIENKYNIEVEVEKSDMSWKKKKYAHLPITWGKGNPSIEDFAGFWGKRKITLKEIRDKAWGRK
jgi:hypothetical protein